MNRPSLTRRQLIHGALAAAAITPFIRAHPLRAADEPAPAPAGLATVEIESTLDQSMQPSRLFIPDDHKKPMPLLVVLHTWTGDYTQLGIINKVLPECRKRTWAMVHPNFRGPAINPEAGGSDLAVQDVLDAVAYVKAHTDIDPSRIYLLGLGGGAHMALLVATRSPQTWAGVSTWGAISDLAAWHQQTKDSNRGTWRQIEEVCDGPPGDSVKVDEEYRKRSPINFLLRARGVAIDLNAGIHDGHTGPVPVSQSLRAFNLLAEANLHREQQFSEAQIDYMSDRRMVPSDLEGRSPDDPVRDHPVLVRREAGPARVTLFNGGHEADIPAAIDWLAQRSK